MILKMRLILVIFALIVLIGLIILCAKKLYIYFNTYMYLSKKQNYDKGNYMANSSFFKYFYNNKLAYGYLSYELAFVIILCILSLYALFAYLMANNVNCGYLNYYYGDNLEYLFVNSFIYLIIFLTIIYLLIFIYWYTYDKIKDDDLDKKEDALRTFIVDNLSYDYLYEYYEAIEVNKEDIYTINNYVIGDTTKTTESEKILTASFLTDYRQVFQLCFTYYILNDQKRFIFIKRGIIDCIRDLTRKTKAEDIANMKIALSDNLKNFYVIANYNHNSNRALPPLDIMVYNVYANIEEKTTDAKITAIKEGIDAVFNQIINNGTDEKVKAMQTIFDNGLKLFSDTIETYKTIYDKYSTYYMSSVLIANFLITYAVLIFIYILLKLAENFVKIYPIYKFRSDLSNYFIYIIILYYFITSPVIIFGFN